MKVKFLTIVILLISCYSLWGQEKVYLDKSYRWTSDKEKAVEYAVITKEKRKQLKVEFFTLDGRRKGMGHYSKYTEDPRQRVKNGVCTYLYANGKDSLVSIYKDNRLEGQSIAYYPNGSPRLISTYKEGTRDGKLIQYYPSGALRRQEFYKNKECTEGKLFAEDGSELLFEPYEVHAEFPGGREALLQLIANATKYPAKAIQYKQQGNVVIGFVINKQGKMQRLTIVRSVAPLLDEEAMRIVEAIAASYTWTPARIDGNPVNIRYNIPINFRLPI